MIHRQAGSFVKNSLLSKASSSSSSASSAASKLAKLSNSRAASAASKVLNASCGSATSVVARCWSSSTNKTRGFIRTVKSGGRGLGRGLGGVGRGVVYYSTRAGRDGKGSGSGEMNGGGANGGMGGGVGGQGFYRKLIQAWTTTPTKWYPLPIAVGALLLVAIQYRKKIKQAQREREVDVNEDGLEIIRLKGPWHVHILAALPLRTTSRLWGYLNSITLPIWFRPYGISFYAWVFGCDLSEAEFDDLRMYESLGMFFERRLKEGVRPLDVGEGGEGCVLVSPADGRVLHFGTVQGSRVEQVKGITYSLDALLGVELAEADPETRAQKIAIAVANAEKGMQVVDHEEFANVNGIEYSLEQLLGGGSSSGSGSGTSTPSTSIEDQDRPVPKKFGSQTDASIPPREKDRKLEETMEHDRGVAAQIGGEEVKRAGLRRSNSDSSSVGSISSMSGSSTSTAVDPLPGQTAEDGKEGLKNRRRPRRSATSSDSVKPGNALYFMVIYLAPGDYHRFHSPTAWVVERRRHFVGELFSVSPFMAKRLENLFVLNERVALLGRWRHGFFGMVPVGATNVGSIKINFDQNLRTNTRGPPPPPGTFTEATYSAASPLLRGQPLAPAEEMGGFSLGSTIVLVFEAPEGWEWGVERGMKVKVGRRLGGVPGSDGAGAVVGKKD